MEKKAYRYIPKSLVVAVESSHHSYIPKPLLPEPPLCVDKLYPLLDNANVALGNLAGVYAALPDPYRYQQ